MHIDRILKLSSGFSATVAGDGVVVDLTGAQIGSGFTFAPDVLEHRTDSPPRWFSRLSPWLYPWVPLRNNAGREFLAGE